MKMIINGNFVDASDGALQNVINPWDGSVTDTVPIASEADVNEAVRIANIGKKIWKNTPLHERVSILRKFVELVERDRDKIREVMINEIGKIYSFCDDELTACKAIFTAYCNKGATTATETLPLNGDPGVTGDIIFTVREPLGVIACIVPYNYPVELYAQKVAPALVAGNAVIVKPASDTPLCGIMLTSLLIEAGVPKEVIQIVTGSGAKIGTQLSLHPDVDAISLTGSTEIGITTAKNGATTLKKVFLELGGNDPLIIFNDADVDKAVSESLIGRASNAGQICCSSKRFLVQKGIAKAYTEKLTQAVSALKCGDPHDKSVVIGPLVNEKAAMTVEKQVNEMAALGAKIECGGKREGALMQPTVLSGVTKDMPIAKDMEVFGPVFPVIEFEDENEALEIANQTRYGLSSGVITNDMGIALKVAMNIEAGTCVINGCGNYRSTYHAFGGYKMTGIGREGCGYTLEEFTQVKSIALKKMIKD